jgi:bifunctional ADP-heptose synthase (sugar kinase/adenylyltransferase)
LASTKTKQTVLVTDITKGVINEYTYARTTIEAINASNSIIMNKLKGKDKKLYKGKYLIRGKLKFDLTTVLLVNFNKVYYME